MVSQPAFRLYCEVSSLLYRWELQRIQEVVVDPQGATGIEERDSFQDLVWDSEGTNKFKLYGV